MNTRCPWPPPDETYNASTAGAYPRKAGSDPSDALSAAGVPTLTRCPQAEHHPQC